jgi:hypothetical protein
VTKTYGKRKKLVSLIVWYLSLAKLEKVDRLQTIQLFLGAYVNNSNENNFNFSRNSNLNLICELVSRGIILVPGTGKHWHK